MFIDRQKASTIPAPTRPGERARDKIAGIAPAREVGTTETFSLSVGEQCGIFSPTAFLKVFHFGTREALPLFAGLFFVQHSLALRSGRGGSLLAYEPFQFLTRPDRATGGKPGSLVYPPLLYPTPKCAYADAKIRRRALCPQMSRYVLHKKSLLRFFGVTQEGTESGECFGLFRETKTRFRVYLSIIPRTSLIIFLIVSSPRSNPIFSISVFRVETAPEAVISSDCFLLHRAAIMVR